MTRFESFPEGVHRVQPVAETQIPQLATFWKPEAKPWGLAIRHLRVTVRLFLVTHEVINREHHLADFTVETRLVPCLEGTEKKWTVSGLPPDSGLTDFKVKS